MKVELHLHTKRYSLCAIHTPREMMRRLIKRGYDAVFVTDHDAVWSDWDLADQREQFPQIRIFPGLEKTLGRHHLLILGTNDPEYLRMERAPDVLAKARAEGCLTVLAHPFRWEGGAELLEQAPLPDALEYRTFNQDGEAAEMAMDAAKRLGLPTVNAGDAHSVDMIGRFWIETERPLSEATDIRPIVLEGAYASHARR
jgi:predicted metal-dependent phosphoesterase TrpH